MLEHTDAITNEVLETVMLVLAYPTLFSNKEDQFTVLPLFAMTYIHSP